MAVVHKSVFLEYSIAQMFALVDRIEDYPKFLPWCGGAEVQRKEGDKVVATLFINGFIDSFCKRAEVVHG